MADALLNRFAGALSLLGKLACVLVVISFAMFANDQLRGASNHQLKELGATPGNKAAFGGLPASQQPAKPQVSAFRKTIDDIDNTLTSPFHALTSNNTNAWVVRGTGTVLALLLYGVVAGYVVRMVRIHR